MLIDEARPIPAIAERRSERVDLQRGTRELRRFIPIGDREIYTCLHVPLGEPVGALVVCTSLYAELIANYRREITLARALAERGFAVQRFHYRGSGHSDDGPETVETMVEDALTAAGCLIDETSVEPPAFLGSRLGALIATTAASRFQGSSVVLWDPILDASRFFREALRLRAVARASNGDGTDHEHEADPSDDFNGVIDVLGFPLGQHLARRDSAPGSIPKLVDGRHNVLMLQLGRRTARQDRERMEHWRVAGLEVETHSIDEEPTWWFPDQPPRGTEELVRRTVDWLEGTRRGGRS